MCVCVSVCACVHACVRAYSLACVCSLLFMFFPRMLYVFDHYRHYEESVCSLGPCLVSIVAHDDAHNGLHVIKHVYLYAPCLNLLYPSEPCVFVIFLLYLSGPPSVHQPWILATRSFSVYLHNTFYPSHISSSFHPVLLFLFFFHLSLISKLSKTRPGFTSCWCTRQSQSVIL